MQKKNLCNLAMIYVLTKLHNSKDINESFAEELRDLLIKHKLLEPAALASVSKNMVTFKIEGSVQSKERPRTFVDRETGKYKTMTPVSTSNYEEVIKWAFVGATRNRIKWTNNEPVWMIVTSYMKVPKSTAKQKRLDIQKGKELPAKKPDVDNTAKVVCDALNKFAYKDDSQIIMLLSDKQYTEGEAYVEVSIGDFSLLTENQHVQQ